MNRLGEIQTALDSVIGFSEQVRLTNAKRVEGINQALIILYDLLRDTSIIKKNSTVSLDSSNATSPTTAIASPPSDFNDGNVLYMGDASTYQDSTEVYEVNGQEYGRWDNEDYIVFTREYNDSDNTLEFHFKGASSGTFYIEYSMGAPTLTNSDDTDGLPKATKFITARIAAGILTDNILSDSTRMQTLLYGPSGNPGRYSPESIMGQLQGVIKKRRFRKQSGRTMQINMMERKRRRFH